MIFKKCVILGVVLGCSWISAEMHIANCINEYDGPHVETYENGYARASGFCLNGRKHGAFRCYLQDSTLYMVVQFRKDVLEKVACIKEEGKVRFKSIEECLDLRRANGLPLPKEAE